MSESRDDAQTKTRGTLLVVDGHSLAFRAFFALPAENFSTQAGQATNAVWGFATMLSQVLDSEKPDHLAVAFDMKGGTFRNEMLPQYKGTREAAPEDLLTQLVEAASPWDHLQTPPAWTAWTQSVQDRWRRDSSR